jgi:hypothetical protein
MTTPSLQALYAGPARPWFESPPSRILASASEMVDAAPPSCVTTATGVIADALGPLASQWSEQRSGGRRIRGQQWPGRYACACSPAPAELTHSPFGQTCCLCGFDQLTLGPQRPNTCFRRDLEQPFPPLDLREHEEDLLNSAVLPAPWINPHEALPGFRTDQHHVVVRGDDHLICALSELQYLAVRSDP